MQKEPENIFYDPAVIKKIARRNLPHWQQTGKMYFTTFRSADSIPQEIIGSFRQERQKWQQNHTKPYNDKEKADYRFLFSDKMNTWLDNCHGECLLSKPACAAIVKGAIEHFEGERYFLDHWVIMPNHVHVLLVTRQGHELNDLFHSWKSFTSNEINKMYSRTGAFWQSETFDHIVRNIQQLAKYREYIRMNIDQAGVLWSEKMIQIFPDDNRLRQDA